jgi:hypothetical protein
MCYNRLSKIKRGRKKMKKYKIKYGSINTLDNEDIIEAVDQEAAENEAYELAIQDYEMYEGMHGIRGVQEIMEEEDITDENEAYEVYVEERDSWLSYEVEEI